MGSTTLTKTVAGATPTSVLLRDPANAYGVRREDNLAVVVPTGTAMTAAGGGMYTYTWTDPAPGLTYAWAIRITLPNGQIVDLAGVIAGTANTQPAYLTLPDAEALAAQLPAARLAAWATATDDQRAAALAAATLDVDAQRYQGRRFDLRQARAFPRLAYQSPHRVSGPGPGNWAPPPITGYDDQVWDWDADAHAAVVPPAVRLAVLYQADSILAGRRSARLGAIHDGVASQAVGGMSESYRPNAGDAPPALCLPAAQLLSPYRPKLGRLL